MELVSCFKTWYIHVNFGNLGIYISTATCLNFFQLIGTKHSLWQFCWSGNYWKISDFRRVFFLCLWTLITFSQWHIYLSLSEVYEDIPVYFHHADFHFISSTGRYVYLITCTETTGNKQLNKLCFFPENLNNFKHTLD